MTENRLWHFYRAELTSWLRAHGRLRLRVMLAGKLSMLAADVDGLRGRFLAIDENGQRIFALTIRGSGFQNGANVTIGAKICCGYFRGHEYAKSSGACASTRRAANRHHQSRSRSC